MIRPRKIATEGALGSRLGDQLVSQSNTVQINDCALYHIMKKSSSLESINRTLPPAETTAGNTYSERVTPRKHAHHSLRSLWQELFGGPTQIIYYPRPPQSRDFSSLLRKPERFRSSANVYGDLQHFRMPSRRPIPQKNLAP